MRRLIKSGILQSIYRRETRLIPEAARMGSHLSWVSLVKINDLLCNQEDEEFVRL